MDCVNIVKMSVKQLRTAVKAKHPKARVSTMNKIQLSSMLLGIKPKIPPPLKKPKIPPPLKAPQLPPKNTTSFNKALTSVRKSRSLKELKTKVVNLKEKKVVKRISKEDKALRDRLIKETKIFNKAIDKNLKVKKKTLSELKQKAPKYVQEKARQATIRKNTPITQSNIKTALSNLKKNDTSSLQPTKVIPKASKNKIKNPSELLAKLTKEYKTLYKKWKENKEKNGYDGKFLSPEFCNNASMNVRFSDNCDTIINQLFKIWIDGKNETTTLKSIKHLEIMISLIKVEIKRNNEKVSYEDLSPASIINN